MKNTRVLHLILLLMITMLASCSNDDAEEVEPIEDVEGRYLVMSSTEKLATGEAYLSSYDSMPSGDIENVGENTSQVDAYGRFVVIDNKWAFKKYKFTGETGIVRYSLSADGALELDGFISSSVAPTYFIQDENTGFYFDGDLGTLAVQTFNPTTMARTGQIDVSNLFTEEDLTNFDINVGSTTLVASEGILFANVEYTLTDEAAEGVKEPHFTMAVIDIESGTAEKLIVHEGEVYDQGHSSITEYPALLVTDEGAIYMSTHALFATDDNGNVPLSCVFRINAGETDFDQDWLLTGSDILSSGIDGLVWSISYFNDKLYVDCSDEAIAADYSNMLNTFYNVYAVDIETKAATMVTGAPATTFGHADGNLFDVNGELYFQVKNDDEGSGYYILNDDDTFSHVFDITDTYPRAIGYLEVQE
ncbi:hypothetical protein [Chondrinema litorale]|uniref:hypothetical protein n=1 Tax=Chondrinema litorale TaxID=2994555 RepID=UPI002542EDB9|nr:hypothetical protein [Chondrinema litorale]UZR96362.1 hypothetical protein OQ292_22150 [Chondrinema litorale]